MGQQKGNYPVICYTALKNLKRRPVRTWCMIFFVFMLSGSLFFSSALVHSMETSLKTTTARVGADVIVVPKEYEADMADSLFLGELCSFTFDSSWMEQVQAVEGIEKMTPQLYMASLPASCCSIFTQLIAFDPETDFIVTPWIDEAGSPMPKAGEMIVGSNVITENPDEIQFFGQPYKIIGRLDKTGTSYDSCAFMTFETAETIMGSEGWKASFGETQDANNLVSSLMIQVEEGMDLKTVARKINFSIENSPLSAYTTNSIFSGVVQSVESMTGYMTVLVALLVILVSVALMCIFTITINERTREFGILASLGVNSKKLSGIVLTEGGVIGLAGSILGVVVAGAVLLLFSNAITNLLQIPRLETQPSYLLSLGLGCMALSVVVSLVSVFYSAWKVSRGRLDALLEGEEL